jgi:hypothetical protein
MLYFLASLELDEATARGLVRLREVIRLFSRVLSGSRQLKMSVCP